MADDTNKPGETYGQYATPPEYTHAAASYGQPTSYGQGPSYGQPVADAKSSAGQIDDCNSQAARTSDLIQAGMWLSAPNCSVDCNRSQHGSALSCMAGSSHAFVPTS
jgi:hypothetical protein